MKKKKRKREKKHADMRHMLESNRRHKFRETLLSRFALPLVKYGFLPTFALRLSIFQCIKSRCNGVIVFGNKSNSSSTSSTSSSDEQM